jgi:hypothetical protein
MFVRDENRGERFGIVTDGVQTFKGFFAGQAGID